MSNKSAFQKRHYEAIAQVLQGLPGEHTLNSVEYRERLIRDLSDLFRYDNGMFDVGRFERACVPGANVRARS